MPPDEIKTTCSERIGFLVFWDSWAKSSLAHSYDGVSAECPACARDFHIPPIVPTRPLARFSKSIQEHVRKSEVARGWDDWGSISGVRVAVCASCDERLA